jgi:hypothetical protein
MDDINIYSLTTVLHYIYSISGILERSLIYRHLQEFKSKTSHQVKAYMHYSDYYGRH